MKILILGPIINEKKSGGVAVFDEGLYHGFLERGDEVKIISDDKSKRINNVVVRSSFSFCKIAKSIKKEEPDLVICSLKYALGIKAYKRKWKKATYVQVFHGFACPINGRFKAWLTNSSLRWAHKKFDHVVSVSQLTNAINKKINLINSDKIITNGVDLEPFLQNVKKEYDFVYIGRLFKDKEIDLICESFVGLKKIRPDLNFAVAGYGDEERLFLPGGKYHNDCITFLGKLDSDGVKNLLSKSKFFISLNSLEPFGIVFTEAIVNGCNVITQSSSGCASKFFKKPYFHACDSLNSKELIQFLENIHKEFVNISFDERKSIAQALSFKRCADEYASLCKRK